jgi:single-strand DNA-binding protein
MSQETDGERAARKKAPQRKTAQRKTPPTAQKKTTQNWVSLIGRVSSPPLERELPSGDAIITFRVVLARDPSPMTKRSRQSSDWVDCVVWGARPRRSVRSWQVDDVVQVDGALRRRFFRTEGGTSTRMEVEVLSGRSVVRAGRADRRERAAEAG